MFALPRGWETVLEGSPGPAVISPASVCLGNQPVSHISILGPRVLGNFALYLKCRQCVLATGNSLCHTQRVFLKVFFPLSLLFQVHWSFFLGNLGQRFLPVDLNLNFLQKLPVVPCQQWTLSWKEGRVSP